MTSISATFLLLPLTLFTISPTCSPSIIDALNNPHPPPDFNLTISNNCAKNPSLRYCNNPSVDLLEVFKSTIVTAYLCHASNNPHCPDLFEKVDFRNRHNIAPLYLSFTYFWKYCPLTITSIDLSNSSLKGPFPSDILQCSQIQHLDVSHNDLSGEFPLQGFAQLTNLTFLNLSYNYFSESKVSEVEYFERFNSSSFIHSGLLPNYHKFQIKAFILLFGFPLCIILMVGYLGFICFYRPDYLPPSLRRQHRFTPAMLMAATDHYSKTNLVGKVEQLEIYRGKLRDGMKVRIEVYRERITGEDYKKFVEECRVLVQLRHKNLVQVLGWCGHRGLKAVVSEWRDGETIDVWLSSCAPPWKLRLKVLRKVLEGMLYLQEQWPEVGFDVNTDSVVLANNGEPLITRFIMGDGNSNKRNIYKFGVFLLEMATRRQPQEFKRGETGFIEWVRMYHHENIWKVIDVRLKEAGITNEQAKQGIRLGLMCADIPTEHHFSLVQVYNIITRFYEACLVVRSPNIKR